MFSIEKPNENSVMLQASVFNFSLRQIVFCSEKIAIVADSKFSFIKFLLYCCFLWPFSDLISYDSKGTKRSLAEHKNRS